MPPRVVLFVRVRCQQILGIDKALPHPHAARAQIGDPDRMEDRKQPPVDTRARRKLRALLQGSHAGGLHQLLGHVPAARQHQAVAPEASEMFSKLLVNVTGGDFSILAPGFRIQDGR